ncbi:hypothetical protein [Ramlibacter montanisoli]|uniref:hypothetical protein n=1 Tax=Ramlibacter montanisoli TaxID=2732512 RepID=UPI00209C0DD5|nr:hypothetical protein [Ramlibacter montanisoli]
MADTPKRPSSPPPTAPPQPETPVQKSEPTAKHVPVKHLELKATLLLAFTVALIVASGLFLLRARATTSSPSSSWCWWPTTPRAWWPAWT